MCETPNIWEIQQPTFKQSMNKRKNKKKTKISNLVITRKQYIKIREI